MSATVEGRSYQQHLALREANRVKNARYRLRCEVSRVAAHEGRAAGMALVAEAVRAPEFWLLGADVRAVLQYAPRVGPRASGFLLALADVSEGRLLRELTDRQRGVLADGLTELARRP